MSDQPSKPASQLTRNRMNSRPFLKRGISMSDVERYKKTNPKKD